MPEGQTTNKLQKLAQNPGLLTLNLGLLFSVPWSLNHLTWKYICLHLHQTNEATGILILVRSNNVKVPSPTGLFLLCLSCLRNRCFGICCVNASFNVTTESGKQWHMARENVYLICAAFTRACSLAVDFTLCLFCFMYLFTSSYVALGQCQVSHKEGSLMNTRGRCSPPHSLLVPFFH